MFHFKIKLYVRRATVLHDRPAAQFQSITLEQKHDLLFRLATDYHEFQPNEINPDEFQATRFTYKDSEGKVHLRSDRPAILISSTSWTPDEDFSILLKALDRTYDCISRKIQKTNEPNNIFRL